MYPWYLVSLCSLEFLGFRRLHLGCLIQTHFQIIIDKSDSSDNSRPGLVACRNLEQFPPVLGMGHPCNTFHLSWPSASWGSTSIHLPRWWSDIRRRLVLCKCILLNLVIYQDHSIDKCHLEWWPAGSYTGPLRKFFGLFRLSRTLGSSRMCHHN